MVNKKKKLHFHTLWQAMPRKLGAVLYTSHALYFLMAYKEFRRVLYTFNGRRLKHRLIDAKSAPDPRLMGQLIPLVVEQAKGFCNR